VVLPHDEVEDGGGGRGDELLLLGVLSVPAERSFFVASLRLLPGVLCWGVFLYLGMMCGAGTGEGRVFPSKSRRKWKPDDGLERMEGMGG
jgi:hypothetical protein